MESGLPKSVLEVEHQQSDEEVVGNAEILVTVRNISRAKLTNLQAMFCFGKSGRIANLVYFIYLRK
jgi:hypothetical protein